MAFSYLLKRLLFAIPVVLLVSLLVFSIMHFLPGDPVEVMLSEFGGTEEDIERLTEELGLDDPVYVQFGRYLWSALHGDLGRSLFDKRPVLEQILVQVPNTVALAGCALLVALSIGIPLGIISAVNHRTWFDSASMIFSLLGVSVPNFWLALVLMLIFSYRFRVFPATGSRGLISLVLPAFSLGIASAGLIARLVRSSMLEVLRQDYMTTARAKGLREYGVVVTHGLKNALIPVVTIIGIQVGRLLGGAVVVETVFARQGLGRMIIWAILQKDYPLVQGTTLFISVSYVLVNILIDWLYVLIDPRIRTENV